VHTASCLQGPQIKEQAPWRRGADAAAQHYACANYGAAVVRLGDAAPRPDGPGRLRRSAAVAMLRSACMPTRHPVLSELALLKTRLAEALQSEVVVVRGKHAKLATAGRFARGVIDELSSTNATKPLAAYIAWACNVDGLSGWLLDVCRVVVQAVQLHRRIELLRRQAPDAAQLAEYQLRSSTASEALWCDFLCDDSLRTIFAMVDWRDFAALRQTSKRVCNRTRAVVSAEAFVLKVLRGRWRAQRTAERGRLEVITHSEQFLRRCGHADPDDVRDDGTTLFNCVRFVLEEFELSPKWHEWAARGMRGATPLSSFATQFGHLVCMNNSGAFDCFEAASGRYHESRKQTLALCSLMQQHVSILTTCKAHFRDPATLQAVLANRTARLCKSLAADARAYDAMQDALDALKPNLREFGLDLSVTGFDSKFLKL